MSNNQTTDKSNKVNRSNEMLLRAKSASPVAGLFVSICFFIGSPVSAQTATWNYVTTITEGVKFYIGKDFKRAPDGHLAAWEKLVKPDRSFAVSFVEWNCREKRRLALETTFYNSDNTVIGTRKQIDNGQQQLQQQWTPVMPGSSAELLFARDCLPAPPVRLAEITVARAALKTFPDASAPVVRTANRGATFRIIAGTGRGGWFNVVDDSTQEDYWLFADDFRVINIAAAEMKKPVKNKSLGKGKNTNKNTSKTANKKTNKIAGKKKS